ncbi:uncharacterized protein [Diadema antillarum]|uniref:uncharacterized protein n=1 Tax=Diadema antillarum TaxID=105358 RepID=UPI003A851F5A
MKKEGTESEFESREDTDLAADDFKQSPKDLSGPGTKGNQEPKVENSLAPKKVIKYKPAVNLYLTKNSGQYFTSRRVTTVPFTCEECDEDFESISDLVLHFRGHFIGSLFECCVCRTPFSSRLTLDKHMQVHSEENFSRKTSKGKCCNAEVNGVINLSTSCKADQCTDDGNQKEELFSCKLCGKSYKQQVALAEHSRQHHNQDLFTCKCGRSFQQQHLLDNHIKIHHVELWACDECGKTFESRKGLMVHLDAHSNQEIEKRHKCGECGKAFVARSKLIRHIRVHTGERPFHCDVCGRGFNDRSNLIIHERVHTGEKPYVCQSCGKCFSGKNDLNRHQMIHSGEKPHTCDECGKAFREKSKLNRHIKTHSLMPIVEKLHSCSTCGKTFREKSKLNRHCEIHKRQMEMK